MESEKVVIAKGDCHGDIDDVWFIANRCMQRGHVKPEGLIVIIAGDFGIPWPGWIDDNKSKLDRLDSLGCEIVAVLGNHEWWTLIEAMPEREFMGALTHDCVYCGVTYGHVHYVTEPTVMTIDGRKYMLIPGADSHDIRDGVISYLPPITEGETADEWLDKHNDKIYKFEDMFSASCGHRPRYRIEGVNWFREEAIKLWELHDVVDANKDVHAIVSHDMPAMFAKEWQSMLPRYMCYDIYRSEIALDDVYRRVNFNHWVHGHFHLDRQSKKDERVVISYYTPIVLSGNFLLTDALRSDTIYYEDEGLDGKD